MIGLGLIGLGDDWDEAYAPALERFANRVEVVAVCDPIAARARIVAGELGAEFRDGIRATGDVPAVDALLVLDVGSLGLVGVQLAAAAGKPVLALTPTGDIGELARLARLADDRGQILVPALAHRYSPATARLRELVATSLGRPREISIRSRDRSLLPGLFDWCAYVGGGGVPTHVGVEPLNGHVPEDLDGCRVRLEFGGKEWMTASVETDIAEPTLHALVGCERGHVRLDFPHTVTWSAPRDESRTEDLSDERPEFDMMLDQFLRRVVGGLVPVPNLDDVRRVLRIEAAARESLRSGGPVSVE